MVKVTLAVEGEKCSFIAVLLTVAIITYCITLVCEHCSRNGDLRHVIFVPFMTIFSSPFVCPYSGISHSSSAPSGGAPTHSQTQENSH